MTHLAGMLDAIMFAGGDPIGARCRLLAHPLGAALRQPALAPALQSLGVTAALAARESLGRSTLDQAQGRGERCLVLKSRLCGIRANRFDLILGARVADRLTQSHLARFIAAAADCLEPGGRLTLSFFVPGHLGSGWQTIWLGQPVKRHEPLAVAAAARTAAVS